MTVGWMAFGTALSLFALVALRGASSAKGVHSFFHIDGLRRNVLSLGIADITLGTGFVYILTASSQFGLFMLAMPLGLLIGYLVLARLYTNPMGSKLTHSGNLLLAVRDWAVESGGLKKRGQFDAMVTIPLIAIYLLFVCFEVFASSQIIAAFIAPTGGVITAAIIGGAIVAVSGLNSIIGGMQSNWRNDNILAMGILLLLFVIIVASVTSVSGAQAAAATSPSVMPWATIAIVTLLALINAAATQIYSLLNAYNASNFERGSDASRSFKRVGIVVAALLGALVLIGTLWPLDLSAGLPSALGQRLNLIPGPSWLISALKMVTIFGMVAVVFSTIDTLMLALAYFVRRHILDRSTERETDEVSLKSSRLLVAALFFGVMPPLALLYLINPDLFTFLLTLAGGASIYAPLLIACVIAMHRDTLIAPLLTTKTLALFASLVALAGIFAAFLANTAPQHMPLASLSFVLAGSSLAAIWLNSRHS